MRHRSHYSRRKQRKRMFYLYTMFLAIVSLSVFLMPWGMKMAESTMLVTYISGVMFWIGLIGTIAMAGYITYSRRKSIGFQDRYPQLKQLGIIHFFQNMPALICDILMFLSVIGFAVMRIWFGKTIYPFVFLSLLIFSFGMHCMLNGSNYIYVNYQTRRATEL